MVQKRRCKGGTAREHEVSNEVWGTSAGTSVCPEGRARDAQALNSESQNKAGLWSAGWNTEAQWTMENGKMEDGHPDDPDLHMVQLQALWTELKVGLKGVVQEISGLQQSNINLEEQVSECKRETAEKILSLRNTLNTLQEDTSTALTQISELSSRQKELQRDLELLPRHQHRKFSRAEDLFESHTFPCSQTQLSLIQHYISSLPSNKNSEQDAGSSRAHSRTPLWKERRDSRDLIEQNNQELSQRQVAALELLESERLYVSYLSQLLKANISFNGCENSNFKDKRPFPSSLRFLIQQHLDLLHLLQERVLKSHWQGIMGDVFLRITSRESDFLDNYVSYLKELPECISVLSLLPANSIKPISLLEGDITGDDTRPSLYTLLLKPVQRIPEYVELLQSLLCQTESEHPDYYLLLVCMQHLRSFTTQYSGLLQHVQEHLAHSHSLYKQQHDRAAHARKDHTRSSVKQLCKVNSESASNESNGSPLTDPLHGLRRPRKAVYRYPDWEVEPQRFHPDVSFVSDLEARHKPPHVPLQRIPETEGVGSALADAMEAFVPYGAEDSPCSSQSHSTDSSIDIAFVRCSPSLNSDHQSQGRGRSGAGGAYRPNRGRVSPDSSSAAKPRPLQAAQRKSKSLNGLQLDNIDSHSHLVRSPVHPRLVRQSSAKPRPSSPERHRETHTHAVAGEPPPPQLHKDTPIWEELKWKGMPEEVEHTPLSERSRKESKGFRSSFKKLFKKKSSGESKLEKAEGQSGAELESGRSNRTDISRGTAV